MNDDPPSSSSSASTIEGGLVRFRSSSKCYFGEMTNSSKSNLAIIVLQVASKSVLTCPQFCYDSVLGSGCDRVKDRENGDME